MAKGKRKEKLNKIANKARGVVPRGPQGEYQKYGDLDMRKIHRGNTSYRGMTVLDSPSTNRLMFGAGVYGEGGFDGFEFNKKIYKFTNPSSSNAHKEVKV